MDIQRNGSQPSGKGAAEYFTGMVRIDPLFQAHDPSRAVGASDVPIETVPNVVALKATGMEITPGGAATFIIHVTKYLIFGRR